MKKRVKQAKNGYIDYEKPQKTCKKHRKNHIF